MNRFLRSRRRYGDNDKHFGPFTLALGCYWSWGILVNSGGNDEDKAKAAYCMLCLGSARLLIELPNLMADYTERHYPKTWSHETIMRRLGRNYYDEVFPREYGFLTYMDGVHFKYGAQTHDSWTDKTKVWRMPWLCMKYIRTSFYGRQGEHLRTDVAGESHDYEWIRAMPGVVFVIEDCDGSFITARTHIEEREWRRGEKWCSWMHWFWPKKVVRSLSINFDKEVGPEKGSWKGGLMGTSIEMRPGELHESAMMRYCEQEHTSKYNTYRIKLLGTVAKVAARQPAEEQAP